MLIAAINVDELIPVLAAIFGVVAWIFRAVSAAREEQKAAPPAAQRPKPAQAAQADRNIDPEIQREIDGFLKEIGAGAEQQRPRPVPAGQRQPPELRPAAARGQAAGQRGGNSGNAVQKGRNQGQNRKPDNQPAAQRGRRPLANTTSGESSEGPQVGRRPPGADMAKRPAPGHTGMGSDIARHAATVAPRVPEMVARDMQPRLTDRVRENLGEFGASRPTDSGRAPVGDSPAPGSSQTDKSIGLESLLRNPTSLRQAMLVNLILQRPTFGSGPRRSAQSSDRKPV